MYICLVFYLLVLVLKELVLVLVLALLVLTTRLTDCYYWPAQWASIVLLAGVCRLSSSVTLPSGELAGRWARWRSGGRHCTAGQYGYVPLGRHLVKACSFVVAQVGLPFHSWWM